MNRFSTHVGIAMVVATAYLMFIPPPVLAQVGTGILRVDQAGGADNPGCGSATVPCANVQYAVNIALDDTEIRLASGTYTFDADYDTQCTAGNTAVICIVNKSLSIRGGFDASDWTVADPDSNLTVIDGENSYRGILVEEGANSTAELSIEGMTVTRCVGKPRDGEINAFGGGLSAVAPDPQKLVVVLRDMVFSGNQAAGENTTDGAGGFAAGGAVSLRNLEPPSTIENVVFNGNQSLGGSGGDRGGLALGGAIYTYQSEVGGADLVFDNNTAHAGGSSGSGISEGLRADALGGAVAAMSGSDVVLDRILAINNTAIGGDAGIDAGGAFGGALYAEGPDADHRVHFTVSDSVLSSNTSIGGQGQNGGIGNGGGVMNSKFVTLNIDRTQLIGNNVIGGDGTVSRGGSGGGAAKSTGGPVVGSSSAIFTNCVFAANTVTLGSGGGNKGGGGGALFVQNLSTAKVAHSTFAENSLSSSPLTGLAITLAGGAGPVTLEIEYSIFADHQEYAQAQAVFAADGNTAAFDTVLMAGNSAEIGGLGQATGLQTLVYADDAGFLSPGAPDFDYHLGVTSAAIDQAAGSTATIDIDGEIRDQNPDIGADEYVTPAGELLFDDFESGDFSAWSSSQP